MSIVESLKNVQRIVPNYWPIGSFIHFNPLKGFEHLPFKEGLQEAQKTFGGQVYMPSEYYLKRLKNGTIAEEKFDKNLLYLLEQAQLEKHFDLAKRYLTQIKPELSIDSKPKAESKTIQLVKKHSVYKNKKNLMDVALKNKTLYEIHDALFGTKLKATVEKEIIEFVTRFLDEGQTTIDMPNRNLGMFETFKLYADIPTRENGVEYLEKIVKKLKVKDTEAYILSHLLKLHGWAGFIKYRSNDDNYYAQEAYPSSLIDYLAIRAHYETMALKNKVIKNYELLSTYLRNNQAYALLSLLRYEGKLSGKIYDKLEQNTDYEAVLEAHIEEKLIKEASILEASYEASMYEGSIETFFELKHYLDKEEGYLWLKSLEDSYIDRFIEEFLQNEEQNRPHPDASAAFCLDVRSEVIRRKIEAQGNYQTFGVGGFLGLPMAFIEFDKAHELFLAPAVIKPQNVVFEIPIEETQEYKNKKKLTKATKTTIKNLKNNPYTPFIFVESLGWLFGVNLFGKTFFPKATQRLFEKTKPIKPKTTLTLNKLSEEEIEHFIETLYTQQILEVLSQTKKHYTKEQIKEIYRHLIFAEALTFEFDKTLIDRCRYEYHITHEDYLEQKQKLKLVGYTDEEKLMYAKNFLTMIGQTENFPRLALIVGHGSVSDNNPFESALDCGACGGNISLPNTRAMCMILNDPSIRKLLAEASIYIPDETFFLPALHTTTTDKIDYYDTHMLPESHHELFEQIKHDFANATREARQERIAMLPYTQDQEDIDIKAMDWSEPRPEWGLAKNYGAFAGPRESIKHMKFDNRLFMHSYDWRLDDENASILTRIFNGPLVVGEWINLEHYFSTVDNDHYGAGSKVYHNVVSKVGVFYGNYSDLRIGLPTQTVLLEGEAYHEPVRLLTYMEAPLEIVGKAVENSEAKEFILNEWIRPVIIDKEAKKVYSYENGDFVVIKEIA